MGRDFIMQGYWNENEAKYWLNEHCLPFTDFALNMKHLAVKHDNQLWYPVKAVHDWLMLNVY